MRFALALLFGCMLVSAAPPSEAAGARIQPTTHGGEISITVAGKASGYHRATAARPVEVFVKGPTAIRVLSRYVFGPAAAAGPITYSLRIATDAVAVQSAEEHAVWSARATAPGGARVGTLEREIVRVPAGEHRVRIAPAGDRDEIAVRILRGSGKKQKIAWVSFAPETYESAVRLHAGDQEETYYRLSAARPVEATIRGPLRMKVTTRIDFGSANGTTQAYTVKVFLDRAAWKVFPLKSRASHTTTYPDLPEVTPGIGRILDLEIPAGNHDVAFHLEGTTAGGAALRIRVPKAQLGLEP